MRHTLLILLFVQAACSGKADGTGAPAADTNPGPNGDTDTDTDTDADTDTDTDTDADPVWTVTWSPTSVAVTTPGAESGYDFGMAETFAGPYGWYGEDCYAGTGLFRYCHGTSTGSLELDSVHPDIGGGGIGAVVEDETTLFWCIHAPYITYFARGWDTGDCWVWGDDPRYYNTLGCTSIKVAVDDGPAGYCSSLLPPRVLDFAGDL